MGQPKVNASLPKNRLVLVAFVYAPEILGVDLKSESLAKEVSRARRRLLADIEVSENGVIEVAGHWIDRQTILQLADVLSEPRNVGLLEDLSADEPLREFLSSASRTWAGRVRQRPYYATEPFKARLVPPLRSALRRALTDCWHAGDGQCFSRVLRVLNHVSADGLRQEVEGFLDGHLRRLKQLERSLDDGEQDPEELLLLAELSESVCVPCLNALPAALASYRPTFFRVVRGISITCHNDFDCSVTAARVLETVQQLKLSQTEAAQRSEDTATIEQRAAAERLESQFGDEVRAIESACEKIENLPPKTAIADPERLRSLVPISTLNQIPSRLRTPLVDRVGLALLLLSTRIWNDEQNYKLSRYALHIAEKMPLSSDGKEAVEKARKDLDQVWVEGLKARIAGVWSALQHTSRSIERITGSAFQRVNTAAVDEMLENVTRAISPDELFAARRRGLLPAGFFAKVVTVASHGSANSIAQWLEKAAAHSNEAKRAAQTIQEKKEAELWVYVIAGIGFVVFIVLILILGG